VSLSGGSPTRKPGPCRPLIGGCNHICSAGTANLNQPRRLEELSRQGHPRRCAPTPPGRPLGAGGPGPRPKRRPAPRWVRQPAYVLQPLSTYGRYALTRARCAW
jgi:hypothetical protein